MCAYAQSAQIVIKQPASSTVTTTATIIDVIDITMIPWDGISTGKQLLLLLLLLESQEVKAITSYHVVGKHWQGF